MGKDGKESQMAKKREEKPQKAQIVLRNRPENETKI